MRLIFGGDTVPTSDTMDSFVRGDASAIFGKAAPIFKSADRLIINLECALTNSDDAILKRGPNLKADPECINGLLAIGVTDVCLANNHTLDFGEEGLRETMCHLDAAGISYTGIGENDTDSRKPYFIEQNGVRVGIINVCEHEYSYALADRFGANPYDPYLTMQDIRAAKEECDYLVVVYHGGKEFCRYPSPRLYNLTHEMVYCGADLVLCQHSHCIGAYELFEGSHIVFGQGNFHFIMNPDECWQTSIAVEIDPTDKSKITFYPLFVNGSYLELAEGDLAFEIMDGFKKRSDSILDGTWRDGWKEFVKSRYCDYIRELPKTIYKEKDIENLAHRLDCEAHLDVLLEVYQTSHRTGKRDVLELD